MIGSDCLAVQQEHAAGGILGWTIRHPQAHHVLVVEPAPGGNGKLTVTRVRQADAVAMEHGGSAR